MQESFDDKTWANKLETGLEAITFLEINDPTNVINDAVDSLYANMAENVAICETTINQISNDAYRSIALARLHYKKIERFALVLPDEFMYPDDNNILFSEEFDSKVFQLWANVNRSILGLEEILACLSDDIATAIRQRVEMLNFAEDFDEWMQKTDENILQGSDREKKHVDIDDTISNAVQSGAASSIIFLLVAAALLAPLLSMCTQT